MKRNLCRQKMWKFTWDEKEFVLRDIADKMITWVNKLKILRTAQDDPVDLRVPWGLIRYILEVFLSLPTRPDKDPNEIIGSCERQPAYRGDAIGT